MQGIVLIEDNQADVFLVKMALAHSGIRCSVIHFENGSDAVQTLCGDATDTPPVPDAILLDLNTPKTDGFAALHKLQQTPRLAKVPIAILTSSRAQSDKHRAGLTGARYIQKPSHLQEFLSTVGQAVKEMLTRP